MDDLAALLDAYARGPQQLRDAVRPATDSQWDATPIAGTWSIRQVVCHLADSEIVYADRMKRVLVEDNPTLFEADPDRFMPALHCSLRPLPTELDLIEAIRNHMLPILRSCSPQDFQRTGVHSTAGPLKLKNLLERVTAHLPHHITFIEQKIRAMA